jgi:hypothetical protein
VAYKTCSPAIQTNNGDVNTCLHEQTRTWTRSEVKVDSTNYELKPQTDEISVAGLDEDEHIEESEQSFHTINDSCEVLGESGDVKQHKKPFLQDVKNFVSKTKKKVKKIATAKRWKGKNTNGMLRSNTENESGVLQDEKSKDKSDTVSLSNNLNDSELSVSVAMPNGDTRSLHRIESAQDLMMFGDSYGDRQGYICAVTGVEGQLEWYDYGPSDVELSRHKGCQDVPDYSKISPLYRQPSEAVLRDWHRIRHENKMTKLSTQRTLEQLRDTMSECKLAPLLI